MKPVVQKDNLGCGIACVAFVLNLDYNKTKNKYFKALGDADKLGYYCKDLVTAFSRAGKMYSYNYVGNKKIRFKKGAIVFVRRSKKFPYGHYLVRTKQGWMDLWINFDVNTSKISQAKAGLRKRIPGEIVYAIVPQG